LFIEAPVDDRSQTAAFEKVTQINFKTGIPVPESAETTLIASRPPDALPRRPGRHLSEGIPRAPLAVVQGGGGCP
jgi:hypothetical protein